MITYHYIKTKQGDSSNRGLYIASVYKMLIKFTKKSIKFLKEMRIYPDPFTELRKQGVEASVT